MANVELTTTYRLTFVEVCEQVGVSEHDLLQLLEQGLFAEFDATLGHEQVVFNIEQVVRIKTAARLRHDLGVNAPGAVLALELLDEMNQLRHALDILGRHF